LRLGWLDPRHATVDHQSVALAAAFLALASVPDPGGTAMLAGRRKLIRHLAPFGIRPVSSRTEAALRTAGDESVLAAAPKSALHDGSFGEFAIGALVDAKLGTGRAGLEFDKEHGCGALRARWAVERRQ
jgi:hypothetical protein